MTKLRLLLAAFLVLAAACSAGGGDEATAGAGDARTEATAGLADGGDAGGAGGASGSGEGAELASTQVAAQAVARQVVRTAEISLTVGDVTAAAADAVRAAEAAGGFQAEGSLALDGDDRATVVVRVPADAFADVLDAIAELGAVADQRVGSEDVTGRVVDLDARIAAARISVERVRAFLDRAADVIQLSSVERELLTRESEFEVLVGQRQALRDQVDLATITARFGVEAAPPLEEDPRPADGIPGPVRALRQGWVLVVDAARIALAVVAFAVPFLPLVLAAAVVVRLRRGRARRLAT